MDGKPTIKIMNRVQLLKSLKLQNSQCYNKIDRTRRFSTNKRTSTPLVSTSISVQRKNNKQSNTNRKLQTNNFMSSNNNLHMVMSCKRMSQCQTSLGKHIIKKQDPIQKTQAQKLLFKNSDKLRKVLWNQCEQYLKPLIISADFITNQDQFWSVPKINASVNKTWKQLHKNYYVIWIIKLQRSYKKIKQYVQSQNLPLHAIYYQKRQLKYTVDYTPLKKQLIKAYGSNLKQIKLVQILKLNTKDFCQYGTFLGKIPLMLDQRFKVFYVRSEQNGQGLDVVSQICKNSQQLNKNKITQLKQVKIFIEQYYKKLIDQKNMKVDNDKVDLTRNKTMGIDQKLQTQNMDQQAQKLVQNFKSKLIDQVIRQKGRNFQYQGFSVHYFIGDIVKRNYNFLLQAAIKRMSAKGGGLQRNFTRNILKIDIANQNRFIQKQNDSGMAKQLILGVLQGYYQYYF